MVTCASCGHENPGGQKFCGECGSRLEVMQGPGVEERKVVTVLFCDLVGFTASSDHADPEDVRARIRPYHQRLRTEIESYGGTVEKFIGDAVMAVFGAPVAHEDDPERAVRAGLRILEAIAELDESDPGLALSVRVGIETGEAVVALGARPEAGEGIVTGDVVNTASRLQGAAPVNGVAVGEGTHRATKDIFDFRAMEPVVLKGKAEPVPLWHAAAPRARFGTDLIRKLDTPLVGRQIDLGILTGTFEKAAQEQTVQLLTVVGEPGVGKSRLVAELFHFVDTRPGELIRWRQGRCLPYGEGITFWALGEILKAEAGIYETDSPEAAGAKIDPLIPGNHPDAPWLRQRLRPLVGLEAPEAAREENFAAWRTFLELLSEDAPSVFVFEDLHWADDPLLAFLEYLADYAEGVPMLVVGTARPELYEKVPGWAGGKRNTATINLSPLSEHESARLIGNLLEQAVLPAEAQSAILDRSGGNPLYTEEFVRLLKDTGILTKQGPTWTLDQQAEIPLPSGVQGIIAARLDTLSPERKQLLQDASVIGKVFWSGAVTAMGDRDPAEVAETLHDLSRKALVRPGRTSSMEGQMEFAFLHALVRDVCYAQIPRSHRAERHVRAAAWIEEASRERVEDHAEILAAHYSTALELATAAGDPNLGQIQTKALGYLTLAGDRALGMDVEAAERHYARALALAPKGHPERARVLARHAEALLQRGRFQDAARASEEAIEGFRERGETPALVEAMCRLTVILEALGDPRARLISAQALALAEAQGGSPELVQALAEEAGTSSMVSENEKSIGLADRAMKLAEELDLPVPARALGFRGIARAFLGDPGGVEDMRQALAAAIAQGLGREGALLYYNLAVVLVPIEGPRASLDLVREGGAFAERRGVEEFVLSSETAAVALLADLGSLHEAMSAAEAIAPRLEEKDALFDLLGIRTSQAQILYQLGEFAQASRLAEWAVQRGRETANPLRMAGSLPRAALIRVEMGDTRGARALLDELEATPNLKDAEGYPDALPDAVRAALHVGDQALAERLADGFHPVYPLHQLVQAIARAMLDESAGNLSEAERLFADVAEGWQRFERPWERAQALLGHGRCLLALGRSGDAQTALRTAREIFARLGAMPSLADTDNLLSRAVSRIP